MALVLFRARTVFGTHWRARRLLATISSFSSFDNCMKSMWSALEASPSQQLSNEIRNAYRRFAISKHIMIGGEDGDLTVGIVLNSWEALEEAAKMVLAGLSLSVNVERRHLLQLSQCSPPLEPLPSTEALLKVLHAPHTLLSRTFGLLHAVALLTPRAECETLLVVSPDDPYLPQALASLPQRIKVALAVGNTSLSTLEQTWPHVQMGARLLMAPQATRAVPALPFSGALLIPREWGVGEPSADSRETQPSDADPDTDGAAAVAGRQPSQTGQAGLVVRLNLQPCRDQMAAETVVRAGAVIAATLVRDLPGPQLLPLLGLSPHGMGHLNLHAAALVAVREMQRLAIMARRPPTQRVCVVLGSKRSSLDEVLWLQHRWTLGGHSGSLPLHAAGAVVACGEADWPALARRLWSERVMLGCVHVVPATTHAATHKHRRPRPGPQPTCDG